MGLSLEPETITVPHHRGKWGRSKLCGELRRAAETSNSIEPGVPQHTLIALPEHMVAGSIFEGEALFSRELIGEVEALHKL